MARYECSVCGYVYDESEEGQGWDRLPEDWTCPVCGAAKSQFRPVGGERPQVDKPDAGGVGRLGRGTVAHRVFGYVFLVIYVVLMFQMVPRLWTYQIEFPARTAVHISLGIAVGVILILKIAIVRFFRRLEETLVPALGTALLVGSVVLIGISVPSAFREALATAEIFQPENRDRVRGLLAQAGWDEATCVRFASTDSLRAGQRVLRQECIECHDLRTVLAKPRTPEDWWQTVKRMAERTTALNPIDEDEQRQVTAYLVALSPRLQRSTRRLREEQSRRDRSREAAQAVTAEQVKPAAYDMAAAKRLFEAKCSQCHPTSLVRKARPGSEDEARHLVARMVEEGLQATEQELSQIVRYLADPNADFSE